MTAADGRRSTGGGGAGARRWGGEDAFTDDTKI